MESVDAVILAAGLSSRANGYKMEFVIEKRTILQHVIDAFLPICENIIVVGGYKSEKLLPMIKEYENVKLVINEHYEKGMFSSVKKGIKHVTASHFFLTPGDYPLITTDICKKILNSERSYVTPSYQNKGGHPILLPSNCIPEILLEDDGYNLKDYLKTKQIYYIDIQNKAILHDVDTEEDFIQAKTLFTKDKEVVRNEF